MSRLSMSDNKRSRVFFHNCTKTYVHVEDKFLPTKIPILTKLLRLLPCTVHQIHLLKFNSDVITS